ncbi:MAG: hypothetical protein PVJ07_09930 [Anaerolineales bacterium]|jgi:hypothetical protein
MEKITLEVGETPQVHIRSIGGDLRLTGREQTELVAQAPEEGKLSVKQVKDVIEIGCRSNCLVFLPAGAQISVETVGGDLRALGLQAALEIKSLGGDLRLQRVGPVTVEQVGGDAKVRKVAGDFAMNFCGGDATIEKVSGEVKIQGQGGDLRLRRVDGDVQASAGGDAWLDLSPQAGTRASVSVGGDLALFLPAHASANILLQAGGDVQVRGMPTPMVAVEGVRIQLGEGEAELALSAGGDAWLQAGEAAADDMQFDLGEEISARVTSHLSEIADRFGSWGAKISSVDHDRIGRHVRRSVKRAVRRSSRAGKRFRLDFETGPGSRFSRSGRSAAGGGATESERMAVLKMLEQGKLTGEQADSLLRALEGES